MLGKTVAVSVSLAPISNVKDVLLSDTEVTSIISGAGSLTIILQIAVFPLLVLAVIVAAPAPTAVILPFMTVTTDLSELVHVTDLSVALLGKTVAVSVSLSPISKVKDVLLSDTEVTSITSGAGSLTVTVQDAVLPLCASAVIVVVPSDLAVTFPSLTAATEEFVLDHVMLLSVALLGETVTTSV